MQWFRMYAKFATDLVVQSLAFEDQRHYVILLCLKCDGILDRDIPRANKERLIYRGLGLDPHAAEEAKKRLLEAKIIDKNWQPTGWDKLQFKSDDSAPRVRKMRKTKEMPAVTVTEQERFSNAPEAEAEAEADLLVPNGTLSGKPDVSPASERKKAAKRVLEFLNQKTGRAYQPTSANLDLIVAVVQHVHRDRTALC